MDWADWFGKGRSVEERANPVIRSILRPIETFFEVHYRKKANGTTVICSCLYEKAIQLGISPENILYLGNGADINQLASIPVNSAREKLGLPINIPIIGYVGTIFRKDANFLINAFERVLSLNPEAHLLIAGYCQFDFKSAISRPNNVIQTGFVDNQVLNTYLSSCDLFWLPLTDINANRCRFPYKLMTYMTIGRPIIATKVGDIPKFFKDREIGLLSEDIPDEFADKTIKLLKSPNEIYRMGNESRELVVTQFSWEKVTDQLDAFYELVLDKIGLHFNNNGLEKTKWNT
jgi:glycosyltransferase involved in cell wall biosynthesis